MKKSLKELAELLDGKVIGDESAMVTGLASLDDAGENDITFLANPKYAAKVATTRAAAVVVPFGVPTDGKHAIEVASPYLAFAKLLTLFTTRPFDNRGVMPGAFVGSDVQMGSQVAIYPGSYVGNNVKLGERVTIYPGAALYDGVEVGDDVTLHANVSIRQGCRIGNRVILHNGAVIGADGFGYAPDGKGWHKIPQVGIVVIEDDVEIGANATIDRAALAVTRIRRGTKIDNLVQIGHNCDIGENCMIVSQVGIAGSTKVGEHVTLGGQVGVAGHVEIGANAMVAGQGGIITNVAAGAVLSGTPAFPHREWLRVSSVLPKLPEMRKTLTALEKKVRELEEKLASEA